MAKLSEYHLAIYNKLPEWNNRRFNPYDFRDSRTKRENITPVKNFRYVWHM